MRTTIALALLLTVAASCWAQSATVSYSDGRPSETVPVFEKGGKAYISVDDVSRLLGLEKTVDWDRQKITLQGGGHTFEILIGGTVWVRDGETIAAGDATVRDGRSLYIGIDSVVGMLSPAFGKSIRWDWKDGRIIVGLPAPNIIDIEVRAARERVSATVKTIGVLPYELMPALDDRIEILIKGGVFSKRLDFASEGGLIECVEAS